MKIIGLIFVLVCMFFVIVYMVYRLMIYELPSIDDVQCEEDPEWH